MALLDLVDRPQHHLGRRSLQDPDHHGLLLHLGDALHADEQLPGLTRHRGAGGLDGDDVIGLGRHRRERLGPLGGELHDGDVGPLRSPDVAERGDVEAERLPALHHVLRVGRAVQHRRRRSDLDGDRDEGLEAGGVCLKVRN